MEAALISRNVYIENLVFTIINHPHDFNIESYLTSDAVIIAFREEKAIKQLLQLFRNNNSQENALKPIFIVQANPLTDPIIKQLTDGVLSSVTTIKDCVPKVKELFLRTVQLTTVTPVNFESQIIKKVLDYLFVRNRTNLDPYIDPDSALGFTWPELSVHFNFEDEHKLFEIMAAAEKEDLFQATFYDRVYLCNNCDSSRLIYREKCFYCSSSNIYTEDLVHHFPCAQISPISDFRQSLSGPLICPKCNKALRHIGVDYDKPSTINHCNTCNKESQDNIVKAQCLLCKCETEVQYLKAKKIYSYKLTTKGHHTTFNGTLALDAGTEIVEGSISKQNYKLLVHYFLERSRTSDQFKSQLGIYLFENSFELLNKIGNTLYKQLVIDIVQLMREYLRSSDLIAVENDHIIYVCINDLEAKQIQLIDSTLLNAITRMAKDNCNFELIIKSNYQTLDKQDSLEKQLDNLAKSIFI